MKRTLIALVAGLMLAAPVAMPAAQAADMKIGVIDVQKILNGSSLMKALEAAQKQVMETEQELVKFRDSKLQDLQNKQKQVAEGKMTQEAFITEQRKIEDEMRQRLQSEQKKLEGKKAEIKTMKDSLEKDVEKAVQKVAGDKGLDMVINKQLVLFGGTDITGDVISALPRR